MSSVKLAERTRRAVAQVLKRQAYVSAVDVFQELGVLKKPHLEDWRFGRVPCLERKLVSSLGKLSRVLREMRKQCIELGLQPSHTAYRRWGKGPKSPLRFSKYGEPAVEQAYSTHWVSKRWVQQASVPAIPPAQSADAARDGARGDPWLEASKSRRVHDRQPSKPVLPPLEKDPDNTRRLAELKRDENLRLRTFLKQGSVPRAEVDRLFHGYHEQIRSAIDCTICGRCCQLPIPIRAGDARRLAAELGQSLADFRRDFLTKGNYGEVLARTPCPFLKGTSCSVYEHRPDVCRSYPHLHKTDMPSRTLSVLSNAEICPIVYNVLECLKHEFGNRWRRG
jgi:Fe-S-cluster containining protein